MARFTVTHIRHLENESHAIISVGDQKYPCVATRRIVTNTTDGQNWVVQTTLTDGAIQEVRAKSLSTAWEYMGNALVAWHNAEDRASKGIVRGRGIKKRSTVTGEDAAYLSRLSKAALVDILTDTLRLTYGSADVALTVDRVREAILPAMISRGDRLPR